MVGRVETRPGRFGVVTLVAVKKKAPKPLVFFVVNLVFYMKVKNKKLKLTVGCLCKF